MLRKQYTTIDKSGWGEGSWQSEPDKVQWLDEATGFPCLVKRTSHSGHWCGYVGVPSSHPAFEQGYSEVEVDVHGGLTFASKCSDGAEAESICHIVEPGEDDNVWWLGFDCAHGGDFCPHPMRASHFPGEQYRNLDWVVAEVENLARQLRGMVS